MLRLRRTHVEDRALLERWDLDSDVVAATGGGSGWDWETELARKVAWGEQLIAEHDNRPIGFIQIIDPAEEPTHYWGHVEPNRRAIDIWIGAPEHRNRGFGSQMMRLALDRCFTDPAVQTVIIDPLGSNTRAIRFYERIGFRHMGVRWLNRKEIAVMQIDRADQEAAAHMPASL